MPESFGDWVRTALVVLALLLVVYGFRLALDAFGAEPSVPRVTDGGVR